MTKHTLKNIIYHLIKLEKALVFQMLKEEKPSIVNCGYAFVPIFFQRQYETSDWIKINSDFKTNKQRDTCYNKWNKILKEWDIMVEELKKEKGR